MENKTKKITEKILHKMNTKFDEVRTTIERVNREVEAAESLAEQNQNNINNLTSESIAIKENLVEQEKKIHDLKENIEEQINRSSRDTVAQTH